MWMIFYRVTYLMKPQHTVAVFDRQKSQTSYQKTKYHWTCDLLRISLKRETCDIMPFLTIIPVGTPVTRRPPDRSQRAGLPHWAPALGKDAQALFRIRMLLIPLRCLPYPSQLLLQVFPALCPVPGLLVRIPLGQSPSLHFLRRCQRTAVLVRKLRRYY